MTVADIVLGMRLGGQAGWNQLEADWRRFLELEPEGCFIAEVEGAVVGTTATLRFGAADACVALVLVDAKLRGQGIGTALMRHALDHLDGLGIQTIRLDATPLGQPIYEKLGFHAEYELARFDGTLPSPAPPRAATPVECASAADLDAVASLDREVSGLDRGRIIQRFFAEYPGEMRVVRNGRDVAGYATCRPGGKAWQIGPCMARDAAGALLLDDAFTRRAGQRVYVDIPLAHPEALALAEARGLAVQRQLLRMFRGVPVRDCLAEYWASSGPEKG